MTPIAKRLAALEAKEPAILSTGHRIIVHLGETLEAAIASYGVDRIAPHDRLIVRTIVAAPSLPRSPARLEVVR